MIVRVLCYAVMAVMVLLSVSVHPVLAQSGVKTEIEQAKTYLDEIDAGNYDLNNLAEMPLMKDNQITAVTLDEVGLGDTREAAVVEDRIVEENSMIPMMSMMPMMPMMSVSDGVTDDWADKEVIAVQGSAFSIHTRAPVTDIEYAIQKQARESLESDPKLTPIVANLTKDGYTVASMSHHQYDSGVTSEKFRGIPRDRLAVAGIKSSDTDGSKVTIREDVTYYAFTNPETESKRILTVMQSVGADGVSLIGDRAAIVTAATEYQISDSGNTNKDVATFGLTTGATPKPTPTPDTRGIISKALSKLWDEHPWVCVGIIAALVAAFILSVWLTLVAGAGAAATATATAAATAAAVTGQAVVAVPAATTWGMAVLTHLAAVYVGVVGITGAGAIFVVVQILLMELVTESNTTSNWETGTGT